MDELPTIKISFCSFGHVPQTRDSYNKICISVYTNNALPYPLDNVKLTTNI